MSQVEPVRGLAPLGSLDWENEMRKVEHEMIRRIRLAHAGNCGGNTSIEINENGGKFANVYLHGNHIASYDYGTNRLTVTLAGWNTNTTRSRIHALCVELGKTLGIGNRKSIPHLIHRDGKAVEVDDREWVDA